MTFLQPWAVWFLAGLPVIVALYFLRHKRQSVSVSTHMFWERVLSESSRRALFKRLRHLLSLLLNLVIFSLIVSALARPLLDRSIHSGESCVLIVDVRARMQAIEPDGTTRFSKAIAAARHLGRQVTDSRQFAIITAGPESTVTLPFTNDEKLFGDALAAITPTDAGGSMESAIGLADALLASRDGSRRIVVLTDQPGSFPHDAPLTIQACGTSRDNVAITRFACRPVPSNPITSEMFLQVRNFGSKPATTDIEILHDGRTIEVTPVTLKEDESRTLTFSSVPRTTRQVRGWLVARLSAPDALPLDNIAFATLPPPPTTRVLLISDGNPFLEKLLAVDPGIKFQLLTPAAWQPALARKFEVIIFDRVVPKGFDLANAEGNRLFLHATPFASGETLTEPLITDVDASHPALRNVSVQNVAILQANTMKLPSPVAGWTFTAPLRSFEHPLLIVGQRPNQRCAALAFDLLESDLPLRVAFPLLISNLVQWLAESSPDEPLAVETGHTFSLSPSQRLDPTPLVTPPSRDTLKPSVSRSFRPLQNGYYAIDDSGTRRWLAANTFDADESNLAHSPTHPAAESFAATPQTDESLAASLFSFFRGWPLWQWLTVAAFVLFTGEWWLFHRRKTT